MTPAMTIADERALLERALARDPTAVRELVRYLEPKLLLRADALLRSESGGGRREAMDLVQVAWRDLVAEGWRALKQWDPDRGASLRGYVGVVATNRMVSELRKQRRHSAEQIVPAEELHRLAVLAESLEARVSDREYLGLVVAELREMLTEQGGEAFEVLYLEGLDVDEAIQRTGLTRDSLYSYRRRIKKMVKTIAERLANAPQRASV